MKIPATNGLYKTARAAGDDEKHPAPEPARLLNLREHNDEQRSSGRMMNVRWCP
jgi:hypothetical protein